MTQPHDRPARRRCVSALPVDPGEHVHRLHRPQVKAPPVEEAGQVRHVEGVGADRGLGELPSGQVRQEPFGLLDPPQSPSSRWSPSSTRTVMAITDPSRQQQDWAIEVPSAGPQAASVNVSPEGRNAPWVGLLDDAVTTLRAFPAPG